MFSTLTSTPGPVRKLNEDPARKVDRLIVTQKTVRIPDMPWLGGPHDGYERTAGFDKYYGNRERDIEEPRRDQSRLALLQSTLSFGFLEMLADLDISENGVDVNVIKAMIII